MFLLRQKNPWKAGIIFFNPRDRRIVVPNRLKMGWTLNMARPWAWGLAGAFMAAAIYSKRVARV